MNPQQDFEISSRKFGRYILSQRSDVLDNDLSRFEAVQNQLTTQQVVELHYWRGMYHDALGSAREALNHLHFSLHAFQTSEPRISLTYRPAQRLVRHMKLILASHEVRCVQDITDAHNIVAVLKVYAAYRGRQNRSPNVHMLVLEAYDLIEKIDPTPRPRRSAPAESFTAGARRRLSLAPPDS